ncbi:Ycf66 family protein [Pseudanabaena sp. 'Roaring Creek']|uniref:Ycf66 family protein n=1 Tax=Pseudanabaena sp. 'Roaring Creek' TaxID=1681830 RepID=UPI0006D8000A|nr:Ycf66 family protein [Pseudanabaena sp. 'Roaring Creek']
MINIGGNPLMILLAIVAALGGVGLYFVRNFRPELARDHDIFFSAIALVYGIILLAFNFRMEITTQLAQVLVVGFAGWFAVESLVLRQALANQARRAPSSPLVDDEEPIGSDYRVEIDPTREIAPRRDRNTTSRRMGGSLSNGAEASELRGDTTDSRRSRRPKRGDTGTNDSVIDIDESDIRPVNPKRRPRPSSDNINGERPRNRNGESDNFNSESGKDTAASGRRRRPNRPSAYPNTENTDNDDF